jgi:hypothetical protein
MDTKTLILFIVTFFFINEGFSQTESGNKLLGGKFGLSGGSDNEDAKSSVFSFAPEFAYFTNDDFALGVNINLGSNNLKNPSYNNQKIVLELGTGVFARYYIKITDNFKIYFNGGIGYLYKSYKMTNTQNSNTNTISLTISPGITYFVTPNVGLTTTFGRIYYSYSDYLKTNSYGIELNSSALSVGLNYYF